MGDIGIQAVEDRLAEAWRYAVSHYRHFRANGVALFFQAAHQFIQGVDFIRVRTEEGVLLNLIPVFDGQRNIAHLRQAAANDDAELRGKVFFGNRPGRYAHRGFARRRTTAAAIVAQTILLLVGVIGVARTEQIFDRAVILRTLIGVLNQQTDTGPGGNAFEDAGEDFDLIRLATLRGVTRGTRATTIEVVLQVGFGQRDARRHAVNDAAQRQTVRFAEGSDAKELSNCISCHHGSNLFRYVGVLFF